MNKKRSRRWLQLLALILLCLTLTVVSLPCSADVFASVGPNSTQKTAENNATEPSAKSEPVGQNYVLNTNTKKFHIPTCRSVRQMKDKNKKDFCGSREEVIAKGYSPCKICSP